MGNLLTNANKTKHSVSDFGRNIIFACSSMQGWRTTMEDTHIAQVELDKDISLFGVFDGHGGNNLQLIKFEGKEVALYVEKYFVQELLKNDEFKKLNFAEALKETFLRMDELLSSKEGQEELHLIQGGDQNENCAGCTANVALIYKDTLYVANAGDSRSVLCRDKKPLDMSHDHKPDDPLEKQRIEKAGGTVANGRIDSRKIVTFILFQSDLDYKCNSELKKNEQLVISEPDIKQIKLTPQDQFLLMGCDGIFDTLSHQELLDQINDYLGEVDPTPETLQLIVESMLDRLVAKSPSGGGVGCDNMTGIIVYFLNPKQLSNFQDYSQQLLPKNQISFANERSQNLVHVSFQMQGWSPQISASVIHEKLSNDRELFGVFRGGFNWIIVILLGAHKIICQDFTRELQKNENFANNISIALEETFKKVDQLLSTQKQICKYFQFL